MCAHYHGILVTAARHTWHRALVPGMAEYGQIDNIALDLEFQVPKMAPRIARFWVPKPQVLGS